MKSLPQGYQGPLGLVTAIGDKKKIKHIPDSSPTVVVGGGWALCYHVHVNA